MSGKKMLRETILKIVFLLIIQGSSVLASNSLLDVRTFGAKGDGKSNDREAVQKCLDVATRQKRTCFLPKGSYKISGDLFLSDYSNIVGKGDKSILIFKNGSIVAEKNRRRDFYYTNNYHNEIIPGAYPKTTCTSLIKEGDNVINVASTKGFNIGDIIYTFNGIKSTWTFFEDQSKSTLFNNPVANVARSETFVITDIENNKLKLDKPLRHTLRVGSEIMMLTGSKYIRMKNFKIVNYSASYSVILEQVRELIIDKMSIEGQGGIVLAHKSINCTVSNCRIRTLNGRSVSLEYFCNNNKVLNNEIYYKGGGDAAILAMMSCYNNVFDGNKIEGDGLEGKNEIGIAIHATSFNNIISNNTIKNTAEGIGSYFRAENNKFYSNRISEVVTGYMAYYSLQNEVSDNTINISSKRKEQAIGLKIFCSNGEYIHSNKLYGRILIGLLLQNSNKNILTNNTFRNSQSVRSYTSAVKIVEPANENEVRNNIFSSFQYRANFSGVEHQMSSKNVY